MYAMPHAATAALRALANWCPAPAVLAVIVASLTLALAARKRAVHHTAVSPTPDGGDPEKTKNKDRTPGGMFRARS